MMTEQGMMIKQTGYRERDPSRYDDALGSRKDTDDTKHRSGSEEPIAGKKLTHHGCRLGHQIRRYCGPRCPVKFDRLLPYQSRPEGCERDNYDGCEGAEHD